MKSTWTPARVALLKARWSDPTVTLEAIAAELRLQKAAVSKKAMRLMLPMRRRGKWRNVTPRGAWHKAMYDSAVAQP